MMRNQLGTRREDETGVTLVELLVVMLLIGVITTAIMMVILSTSRAERTGSALASVMDDGRLSMDNLRMELRGARRVYASSDGDTLKFWVDANFDDVQQTIEQITYQVESVGTGRYVINRWTEAAPSTKRLLAKTLLDTTSQPVTATFTYDATPPATRVVTIRMTLQVEQVHPLQPMPVSGSVRLRNVADPT